MSDSSNDKEQADYEAKMMDRLRAAREQVKFGGTYRHYKAHGSHGKVYQVQGFVIIESSGQVGVVYQAQYGERLTFMRPLKDWLEDVEVDGKQVPRFKEVRTAISDFA